MSHHEIIRKRALDAWSEAFCCPRWHYGHGSGPFVALTPCASRAIDAGASVVKVAYDDCMTGRVNMKQRSITIDGNTHDLIHVPRVKTECIEIAPGNVSVHVNIDHFLSEIEFATHISAERINVHIDHTGLVDVTVAPHCSWVDPLIRSCAFDQVCVQQFIVNHQVGGVDPAVLVRLFGPMVIVQCPSGTPDAIAPFVSPVNILLDDKVVFTLTYMHTVFDLLGLIGHTEVFLHGVKLQPCGLCLWTLSPVGFGCIYLYTRAAKQTIKRSTIGAQVALPKGHSRKAFVPCMHSFTLNAFAPPMRYSPRALAKVAPEKPTCIFIQALCQGEPLTVSRAKCIFRHLQGFYDKKLLRDVLLSMALDHQAATMSFYLDSDAQIVVHYAFDRYVKLVSDNL